MEGITYGNVLICMNGHLINAKVNDEQIPEKFCATCGDQIINKCLECGRLIKGKARIESQTTPPYYYDDFPYSKPSYCIHCSKPYPWTKRAETAAIELIDFADNLTDNEKSDLKKSIDDLLRDTPNTIVAGVKFKKYAAKAGIEIAKGLKDVLVDLVSETVKKSIWH